MAILQLGWGYSFRDTEPPNKVTVDAIQPIPREVDLTIIHDQDNGLSIDNPVCWWEELDFDIGEDELGRKVLVGGQNVFVTQLVKAWRRAPVRWIKCDLFNMGAWTMTSHREAPAESSVEGHGEFKLMSFKLKARVVHLTRKVAA
jgi:hypothetical protein